MRTTIDKAGRVVLPKAYRDRLGLRPGQELDIDESDSGVVITPVVIEPTILEKSGGPVVVSGESCVVLTDEMVRELLESGRP